MFNDCVFLGVQSGVSKSSNKPYAFIYLAVPFSNGYGRGYSANRFFVDQEMLQKVNNVIPMDSIKADIRYINGANALIDLEV